MVGMGVMSADPVMRFADDRLAVLVGDHQGVAPGDPCRGRARANRAMLDIALLLLDRLGGGGEGRRERDGERGG